MTGASPRGTRAFFRRMVEEAPSGPDEILYVGDRLDNDIRLATGLGLRTALIRRGPWAMSQQDDPDATRVPTIRVGSLTELPGGIAAVNAGVC